MYFEYDAMGAPEGTPLCRVPVRDGPLPAHAGAEWRYGMPA